MQKFITLIITGAIIYMVIQYKANEIRPPEHLKPEKQQEENNKEQKNSPEPQGNFIEKTISNVLLNILQTEEGRMVFENILQPMNKPLAGSDQGINMNNNSLVEAMFDIKTFGDGKIGPASCGHIVTIEYKIYSANNVLMKQGTDTFSLGSEKILPGLDAVIVGMKVGQTRNAVIASKYTNAAQPGKNALVRVSILLNEIMPHNFADDNVKIFDDTITYKLPLLCGNKAIFDAKITHLGQGKVIFNSENQGVKINMNIGNLNYPVIFSHSLHNKIPIGTRTVITKGSLLKSFVSDYSSIFPDTKMLDSDFFMIEFSNFEIGIQAE